MEIKRRKTERKTVEGYFSQEFYMGRKELAGFLRNLADQVEADGPLRIVSEEWELPFTPAPQAKVDLDLDDDELEIEIEFKKGSPRIFVEGEGEAEPEEDEEDSADEGDEAEDDEEESEDPEIYLE